MIGLYNLCVRVAFPLFSSLVKIISNCILFYHNINGKHVHGDVYLIDLVILET